MNHNYPDLRDCRAFMSVYRHQSFRRAAEEIGLSPSALSRQIVALEETVGARLFNRDTRNVFPTDQGAAFATLAERMLNVAGLEMSDFQAYLSARHGRLVIAGLPSVTAGLLPRLLTHFKTAHPKIQAGLMASRQKEWDKWKNFHAGIMMNGPELQELIDEGHTPIPTQWVEVDKKDPLRKPDTPIEEHETELKSRLVVRGDLEKGTENLRSDSPTCDTEAQNLIFSFAASHRLKIRSIDITNAYFQGETQDRLMLLKQPSGGLPGEDPDAMMLARVPVYGTKDAGRKFWKRLRKEWIDAGFRENHVLRALYSYTDEKGNLLALVGTHVDDVIWAAMPEAEAVIRRVIEAFKCGEPDECNFRYCGKEVTQDSDFNIRVTCKATTDKLEPIRARAGRKNEDKLNEEEISQMKSIAGSLQWIARQVRPELDYSTSKVQQIAANGSVDSIKFANKVVRYAKSTSDRGLTFKSGIVDWNNMSSIVVTDASHANEEEIGIVRGKEKSETHRSQGGRMQLIGNSSEIYGDKLNFHLIGHASNTLKRVCRATVQAETYGLSSGVEEGDRLRAAIADLYGKLDYKKWEASAAAFMPQMWFTDCRSVRDALTRPVFQKMADKRLSIEISSLRQNLWREPGEAVGSPQLKDEIPENATDKVRWIDTDVMIADPLTKTMEPIKMVQTLDGNLWDLEQPIEAVQKKRAKQNSRRKIQKTIELVHDGTSKFVLAPGFAQHLNITRRLTRDATTGEVIDDDFRYDKRTPKYLARELPKAPRSIRTTFYYVPAAEVSTTDTERVRTDCPESEDS